MQGITSVQNPLLQFVVIQIRKESVSSGKLEQPLKRCSMSNHIPVPLFYIFLNYCRDELIGFSRTGFYTHRGKSLLPLFAMCSRSLREHRGVLRDMLMRDEHEMYLGFAASVAHLGKILQEL